MSVSEGVGRGVWIECGKVGGVEERGRECESGIWEGGGSDLWVAGSPRAGERCPGVASLNMTSLEK